MTKHAEATFGDELKELEKVIKELEGGKLDLDAALKRFEDGIALTRRLRARLDAAEGRVEQLLDDGGVRRLHVE